MECDLLPLDWVDKETVPSPSQFIRNAHLGITSSKVCTSVADQVLVRFGARVAYDEIKSLAAHARKNVRSLNGALRGQGQYDRIKPGRCLSWDTFTLSPSFWLVHGNDYQVMPMILWKHAMSFVETIYECHIDEIRFDFPRFYYLSIVVLWFSSRCESVFDSDWSLPFNGNSQVLFFESMGNAAVAKWCVWQPEYSERAFRYWRFECWLATNRNCLVLSPENPNHRRQSRDWRVPFWE